MKIFGIHVLRDHTLQVLLETARNTAMNEIAYQKVRDQRQDMTTVDGGKSRKMPSPLLTVMDRVEAFPTS